MQNKIIEHFENDDVMLLTQEKFSTLEKAHEKIPRLTKGWYELSKLEPVIRFEFLRDYWINALNPIPPTFLPQIDRFFARVKDTEILAVKGAVYIAYIEEKTVFLGGAPLTHEETEEMKRQLDFPIPWFFQKFYRIHNGFFKLGDTGIFSAGVLVEEAKRFKTIESPLMMGNLEIYPEALLPFYRSFGLDVFQCFYKDWYPDEEVGNVLVSLREQTVSDYRSREKGRDALAFPAFLEWLNFYLEDIDI